MRDQLQSIVKRVNAAKDLQSALDIIVSEVRSVLDTPVCSVFLLDTDINAHVLMASEGLKKEAIGHVSLEVGEGLVGLVAKHAEPLNLQDAALHPSFHYLEDTGEEVFHSFLGVPIIHHRSVLGVLVAQHEERRRFDEAEEAFLITLSAQLAGVIRMLRQLMLLKALVHLDIKLRTRFFQAYQDHPVQLLVKPLLFSRMLTLIRFLSVELMTLIKK